MAVELRNHNAIAYENIKKHLENTNRTCAIHATGTGKSFLALKFFEDNLNKKLLFLAPNYPVIYQFKKNILKNIMGMPSEELKEIDVDELISTFYPDIDFELYLNADRIANNKYNNIVMDEFHRCGAKEWSKSVNRLLDNNEQAKILGITATPIRYLDKNKDMSKIIFDGDIASELSLVDAICQGILPAPTNVNAIYSLEEELDKIQAQIDSRKDDKKDVLQQKLNELKHEIEKADGLDDIFGKYMPKNNGKYIVFCRDINDLHEKERLAKEWFSKVNSNITIYDVHSQKTNDENQIVIDEFEHNTDNNLKLLYCVEMLNEGLHVDDIDGVIMLRPTKSPIIYLQQLGRALSVGKKNDPIIFDVVNNIECLDYIYQLKKGVEDKRTTGGSGNGPYVGGDGPGDLDLIIDKFKIYDDLIDIKNRIKELEEETEFTWYDWFCLAKAYYEHNGNLRVPRDFKTKNGYEEDENGFALGQWISTQRTAAKLKGTNRLTDYQRDALNEIGMLWEVFDETWDNYYELAKAFYDHRGHLRIPLRFKTINGYDEDENGVALGRWLSRQKQAYKGKGTGKITLEQIKKLENIGINWIEDNKDDEIWDNYYELAKAFYDHRGHLRIPKDFITINGYDEDENGVALGGWIQTQRRAFKGSKHYKITQDRIKKLNEIEMIWNFDEVYDEQWMRAYELAKAYYDHRGNLDIKSNFTTINGYEEDENGFALGSWLATQRRYYKGQGTNKITPEQTKMLDDIGMDWFPTKDIKIQQEEINEKNTIRKQKEVLNRFYTLLNKYHKDELPEKEVMTEDFIEQLNNNKSR